MLDFDNYRTKLPYVPYGKDKNVYEAYRDDVRRLEEKFKTDTLDYLGLPDNAVTRKMMAMAWEQGHSGGFSEVYGHMQDFVELFDVMVDYYNID